MGPPPRPVQGPPQPPLYEVKREMLLNWNLIKLYARHEEGQTMAEYGVVLGVIVLGVIVAITALAAAITGKLGSVTTLLTP